MGEEVEPPTPTALTSGPAGATYGAISSRSMFGDQEEDNFAGTMKKDLVVEFEAEEIDMMATVEPDIDDEIDLHNKETLKVQNKKEERRKSKSEGKHRHVPSILKLLEKVSHLHEKQKTRPMVRRNAKIERTVSSGSQKIKRPSLKVYQNNPKHGTGRRATAPTIPTQPPATEAKEARMVITGRNNAGPRLSIRRNSRRNSSQRGRSASVTTTGLKVSQVTEAELRSAHLEMMIKILATLYEEKISKQDSEIKSLRDKFKSQDKIVKQIVHNMLEVKAEVSSIKDHLLKHEEVFELQRPLIGQQSIPEEMEETEDLEMFDSEPQEETSPSEDKRGNPKPAQEDSNGKMNGHKVLTPVKSNVITVQNSSNLMNGNYDKHAEEIIPQVFNMSKNDFLSDAFLQVLEPPDEFQSKDFDDIVTTPVECHEPSIVDPREYPVTNFESGGMYPGKQAVAGVDVATVEQVELLTSFRSGLDMQDCNEFDVRYCKMHDGGEQPDEHDEPFFATQYVCDYHPREEIRVKQFKDKSFFEETLSNIDEDERVSDGRCSVISRQRSDDSTNI